MCTLIREDFSGIWVGYHREDLLQRLDYILRQLDLGLGHLQQHKPSISASDIWQMRGQYEQLKEVLLEVDREAIDRLMGKLSRFTIFFS